MARWKVICSGCRSTQDRELYVEGPGQDFVCEHCGPLTIDPAAWSAPESKRQRVRFYRRGGVRTITGHPRPVG